MKINIRRSFQLFYSHTLTLSDWLIISLIALCIMSGGFLTLINHYDFHYTSTFFFATHVTHLSWLEAICVLIMAVFFIAYSAYIRDESPRSSTFILGFGFFTWCLLANLVYAYGLQTTPFSPIDLTLAKADYRLGVYTPAVMQWTHTHPVIHHYLNKIYLSLVYELIFVPLVLSLFFPRKLLYIFYITQLSSILVGGAIYYFFPTMAPSGIFHSPFFSPAQHDTSMRFYEVHHFLKVTSDKGGLIAFPSFHVVWAILVTYPFYRYKVIFYPMVIFNVILIASTVLLGWHYFTDVLGGIVLAGLSILFAERMTAEE